ncbi:restriction endonuclease subunit S [Streptomyces capoamus]|uniref:restriction endonuclease subunit S n=1 Tax=Streptomyces capoamus TaxID=68183 RepID=UPI00339192EA
MDDRQWNEVSLGDVVNLKRGYDLPAQDRISGHYPVVSSSGFTGTHEVPKVEPPGVVTGRYGTLGKVYFVDEPFWPLNTTLYVQDFKGNDPRYVAYLLESLDLSGLVASAAVPGINRNHLHPLRVRIPEVTLQQKLAGMVSVFDRLIENNRRRIWILEDMARLVYREWFIYFRFPSHESVKIVDSDLGRIPARWEVSSLEHLQAATPNATAAGPFGSKLGRKDYVDEPGVPVIRGANLRVGGGFVEDEFIYVSQQKAETLTSSLARPGDVVVTQRGTLGQVGLIPESATFGEYVLSQSQMKFTADPNRVDPLVIYMQLADPSGAQRIQDIATGAGVPHINLTMFREMRFLVPPRSIQDMFAAKISPLLQLSTSLTRQNRVLTEVRDLLLPRLISGELDLSDLNLRLERMG